MRRATDFIGCFAGRRRCSVLVIIVVTAFFVALKQIRKTPQDTKRHRLLGPLSEDDPFVVNELRQRYMHDTSGLSPERFERKNSPPFVRVNFSEDFYNRAIKALFLENRLTGGYFVEAGALDGISSSNTLKLETDLHWDGILIEPDGAMFKLLLEAKRRSRFINACISPHRYPYKALIRTLSPPAVDGSDTITYKSMNTLLTGELLDDRIHFGFPSYQEAQCFPISSILLAAQVANITLFSLDVEDVEWEILRTFPFEKVQVDVWFVEHRKVERDGTRKVEYDPQFVLWFSERNYTLYDYEAHNVADYVFVRNGSSFARHRTSRPLKNSLVHPAP